MDLQREVNDALFRLRQLGNQRLRECEIRDDVRAGRVHVPEPSQAELMGRAYRQLHDGLVEFATAFARGWNAAGKR